MKVLVAGFHTPWTQGIAAELYAPGLEVRVVRYRPHEAPELERPVVREDKLDSFVKTPCISEPRVV